jgi:threonine/homoserine/homoserine lactone efflux protein
LLGAVLGFFSGFLGAMPVAGPIALIVFRSSMRGHFSLAIRVVSGAAVAEEVIYCALATFGYIRIIAAYPFLAKYLRYIGASFLVILGVFSCSKSCISQPNLLRCLCAGLGIVTWFSTLLEISKEPLKNS